MKIVQLAPDEAVPPQKYGGTELVIYNQIEEMVKLGHEVYLLGPGTSKTSAKLVPIFPTALREMLGVEKYNNLRNYYKIYAASLMVNHINQIKPDVVINHADWRFLLLSHLINVPIITVMHILKDRFEDRETYFKYKDANYVSISNNQRKGMPELNWVKTIYNGIDVESFPFSAKKEDYFLFLGRTSPEKGLAEICRMIKKSSFKLKIAAKIDTDSPDYYENEVKPLIDGEQIEYVGEVDHYGKSELLRNAKGLLLWLNWEEPFGLVVPEAYACGTPVIVNRRGSMPEIVENGKTGFLVDSLGEMLEMLPKVCEVDSSYCREYALKRFSKTVMVKEYIELAKSLQ